MTIDEPFKKNLYTFCKKSNHLFAGDCEKSGYLSGGVVLRIVIVLATLLLVGVTVIILLKSFRTNEEVNGRKVISICEYGLLQAMQKINEHPEWREGFDHIEYEDGWYTVTLKTESFGDTIYLNVVSRGHIGTIVDQRTVTLRRIIAGQDTIWSRF